MRQTSYIAIAIITVMIIAVSTYGYSDDVGTTGIDTNINTNIHTEKNKPTLVDRISFLSEYHFYQDIRTFTNHKNSNFRTAYMASALTEFEAMVISIDTVFHFGIRYDNYLGMGRQNKAVVFDPRDVAYAVIPFFEFRRDEIFYQAGLDHRCHHEVDRATRIIPPYWNQPYISASSANYRFSLMKNNYINTGRDGWRDRWIDRLRWQARVGYFVREMGGMDRTILGGGHPWVWTVGGDVGYFAYRTKSWLFGVNNKLTMLGDTLGTIYWTGAMGVDADVYNRKHTAGFFVIYNYEFPKSLPLLSRDRLVEVGLRFRY